MASLSIRRIGTGRGVGRVFQGILLMMHLRPLVGEASSSPVGRLEVKDLVGELASPVVNLAT